MKNKNFLWLIMVDCFLLTSSVQSSAITEKALLSHIEQIVQTDTKSCIMYDRVVHDLVSKIMQSGYQDDDVVKLMHVLLAKQASILEKLEYQKNERKSRIRFTIKPFEVLVVLLLIGILYGVWAYFWDSAYLELLKDLLFDWLQKLRDLLPSWGSIFSNLWGSASSNFSSQSEEKKEQNSSDREGKDAFISAGGSGESASGDPEKSYDNSHGSPLQRGGNARETFHEMPVNGVESSLFGHDRCDTFVEAFSSSSAVFANSNDLFRDMSDVGVDAKGYALLCYESFDPFDTTTHLDRKLLKEVKKQQEEIMKLLGLTEMPQVSPEEIEVTKKQLDDMLMLEDHIVYAEYIMNKLDPEVRAKLNKNS